MLYGRYDLGNIRFCLLLKYLSLVSDSGVQFPVAGILHDDENLGKCFDDLIESNNVWVVEAFHARYFSRQEALHFLLHSDFVQNFDGNSV